MRTLTITATLEPPEDLLLYPDFVITRMRVAEPCALEADHTLQQDGNIPLILSARGSSAGVVIGRVPLSSFRTVLARFAVFGGLENIYGDHALFACDYERDGVVVPHRFSMFLSNEPTVGLWLRLYVYGIDGVFPYFKKT